MDITFNQETRSFTVTIGSAKCIIDYAFINKNDLWNDMCIVYAATMDDDEFEGFCDDNCQHYDEDEDIDYNAERDMHVDAAPDELEDMGEEFYREHFPEEFQLKLKPHTNVVYKNGDIWYFNFGVGGSVIRFELEHGIGDKAVLDMMVRNKADWKDILQYLNNRKHEVIWLNESFTIYDGYLDEFKCLRTLSEHFTHDESAYEYEDTHYFNFGMNVPSQNGNCLHLSKKPGVKHKVW